MTTWQAGIYHACTRTRAIVPAAKVTGIIEIDRCGNASPPPPSSIGQNVEARFFLINTPRSRSVRSASREIFIISLSLCLRFVSQVPSQAVTRGNCKSQNCGFLAHWDEKVKGNVGVCPS